MYVTELNFSSVTSTQYQRSTCLLSAVCSTTEGATGAVPSFEEESHVPTALQAMLEDCEILGIRRCENLGNRTDAESTEGTNTASQTDSQQSQCENSDQCVVTEKDEREDIDDLPPFDNQEQNL